MKIINWDCRCATLFVMVADKNHSEDDMAKKKYSTTWEYDIPISFEVDGVQHRRLEDIASKPDRPKLETIRNSYFDTEFDADFGEMNRKIKRSTAHRWKGSFF